MRDYETVILYINFSFSRINIVHTTTLRRADHLFFCAISYGQSIILNWVELQTFDSFVPFNRNVIMVNYKLIKNINSLLRRFIIVKFKITWFIKNLKLNHKMPTTKVH